jgi:acyl-CoA dehydrogenase
MSVATAPRMVSETTFDWRTTLVELSPRLEATEKRSDQAKEYVADNMALLREHGFFGLAVPSELGGAGLLPAELAEFLRTLARISSATALTMAMHTHPVAFAAWRWRHQKAPTDALLKRIAAERLQILTSGGSDWLAGSSTATKVEGGYKVNGRKVFISRAEQAERLLLITRTAPRDASPKATDGMTLFFPKMDPDHIKIQPIPKLGRNAVSTNMLFIDDLFIPDEDRIGEEGKGFKYLLAGLNAERIIVAGGCLGMGRAALRRATEYVKQRHVFGRPIGMNQGVQFPLADSLAKLDAVELLIRKAAWMYDNGIPCGKEANEAKYLASTWAFEAADRAMQVHGGYGYTSEYHVERYWRESRVQRIAPISNELVLAYLGEKVLGLPRSY